jgi:hypothetical protein
MPLTTAGKVASELRKIAESLEQQPDAAIGKPYLTFSEDKKEPFLAVVRLFPHPLKKGVRYPEETYAQNYVRYETDGIILEASVQRDKVCRIVEPAKPPVWECDPILSDVEESTLTAGV